MTNETSPLEQYIAAAKRQWWVILQAVVIVALGAAFFATREPDPPYSATTTFLVRPEYDANGRIMSTFDVTVTSQARNLRSPVVLQAAATALPGETPASIGSALGVASNSTNGIITLMVRTDDALRAVPIANAVADAFVADRTAAKAASLEREIQENDADIDEVQERIGDLTDQIAVAEFEGRNTTALETSLEVAREQLSAAVTAQGELRRDLARLDAGIAILTTATVAVQDEKPSPVERGLLGAGIGLLIGIALAALRESLDKRLRTRSAVEDASGLPVIAQLPEERIKTRRRELPVVDQPHGPLAEAFRGLRTTTRYLGASDPIHSLVVTSPQPGDGKTLTAANLAASYAASGVSTILVSADLRKPGIDDLFDTDGMVGLSDVLGGTWPGPASEAATVGRFDADPSDDQRFGMAVMAPGVSAASIEPLLRPTIVANLMVLPAGRVPPNPAELLASERASKVFSALGDLAEMVIVDSPPTVVADSTLLAGLVDAVVVVVALDRTQRSPVRQARQALDSANARVIGIVLNRVHAGDSGYAAYYHEPPRQSKRSTGRSRRKHARRKHTR